MNNVVLIGFMGTGKSSVGRVLAQRTRRPFLDLDELIEQDAGRPIAEIFEAEGERGFRARESATLARALADGEQVVAVGGGAPMAEDNWRQIRDGNVVVALTATAETLRTRLGDGGGRPLLKGGVDAALTTLLAQRMRRYEQADLVIDGDGLDPAAVAVKIADALPVSGLARVPVDIPGAEHEITLGYRLAGCLAPALRRAGVTGKVAIVTDESVGPAHSSVVEAALSQARFVPVRNVLPKGEQAKAPEPLLGLYDFLASSGVDRHGAVVALGGGSVGDVAGFAAASWLRGIPCVQMPTTLLAVVDSSIGGKTAINLAAGKNLVGAVYQPVAILSDLNYLTTLPPGELSSGWAEIIKTAIIGDASLFDRLQAERTTLMAREIPLFPVVVARACAFKAQVVAEDPLERGPRAILNYGHTVGHALEAAAGYGSLLHGAAVAWGMRVAGTLSVRLGLCQPSVADAQAQLLADYGLLAHQPQVPRARLLAALRHDKKAREGEPRWVLLRDIGRVESGYRVSPSDLEAALDEVLPA